MGWEEQSLPDLQEEPVNSLSGQEGNWQSHGDLAFLVVRQRRGDAKLERREMTSKGFDKECEMLCVSPKRQVSAELSSAHLLHTGW